MRERTPFSSTIRAMSEDGVVGEGSQSADAVPAVEAAPEATTETVPVVETPTVIEAAPAAPEPLSSPPPAPTQSETSASPSSPPPPLQPVTDTSIKNRLNQALEAIRFRRRAKLDKILVLAAKKNSIKNDDVEKLLRVSDSTAQRYLNQLVLERKLRRSGPPQNAIYERV